jgi:hypothetical protein
MSSSARSKALVRIARNTLLVILAVSGTAIALRTLAPAVYRFKVGGPVNPESWFAVALILSIFVSANRGQQRVPTRKQPFGRNDIAAVFGLTLLTAAGFWRALPSYFLSDDFILLEYARTFHGEFRSLFAHGGGDGFFRPIGYLSLALTSAWAGASPLLWHAAALALHMANSAPVYLLAVILRRSRLAALFAAAVFAIHGTRPEVTVWIAGRFDLLSTFFVLCGLLFFMRSQTEVSPFVYVYRIASPACMILGILTKESAYVFPVQLLFFPLTSEGNFSWRKIGRLAPLFTLAAALFAYRWVLFGDIGGYRDVHTGGPQVLSMGGVQALKALLVRVWAILFFPINWSREPSEFVALLMIVYVLPIAWLALVGMNRMEIVFPLTFVLLAALPPLHLLLIGQDLGKSRLLYLPSIGFSLLLATVVDNLRDRVRWIILVVVLAFHASALQHNLDLWEYASAKAKSPSAAAVKCAVPSTQRIVISGLPGTLEGIPFFANGFREGVELQRGGELIPVVEAVNGSPSDGRAGSCVLLWDAVTDELRAAAH